jgi:two-component system, NarL family, invasion response regulator UvrY
MIQILIVDDHPIVRKGLYAELMSASDITVVGEAATGEEALLKVRACKPDIVLLDISLPGMSGFEVLKQLQVEMPNIKILMLSTYPEKQYAVRCLRNGASGYLTKESASEELLIAIRKVAQGGRYVSMALADIILAELDNTKASMLHERLSDREYQILCLLGKGKTVTEVSEALSLSVSTVNTHRLHIFEKMQFTSTPQLIHYVLEHHLVDTVV